MIRSTALAFVCMFALSLACGQKQEASADPSLAKQQSLRTKSKPVIEQLTAIRDAFPEESPSTSKPCTARVGEGELHLLHWHTLLALTNGPRFEAMLTKHHLGGLTSIGADGIRAMLHEPPSGQLEVDVNLLARYLDEASRAKLVGVFRVTQAEPLEFGYREVHGGRIEGWLVVFDAATRQHHCSLPVKSGLPKGDYLVDNDGGEDQLLWDLHDELEKQLASVAQALRK